MLVLSSCLILVFFWLIVIQRQLSTKRNAVFSALTSLDNCLKQQIYTILKVVHHAEISVNQKEPYLKSLNDYRHAFQSDILWTASIKDFQAIQHHLIKCNDLNHRITQIADQLNENSQPIYVQSFSAVHSEFQPVVVNIIWP